jgi:hypothetical protein
VNEAAILHDLLRMARARGCYADTRALMGSLLASGVSVQQIVSVVLAQLYEGAGVPERAVPLTGSAWRR